MEAIVINYYAVLAGAVASMIIGGIWYGPLFGKKWLEIIGANEATLEARKEMQKNTGPMYGVQFILTLFQVLVLAHLIAESTTPQAIQSALWVWAAFVIPTLAGAVMWTTEPSKNKWARFLIQGGYQLVIFLVFGLLLHFWK